MTDNRGLFDKIVDGTIPSFKVWEDSKYLAFLTPYPNAVGFTVVIPKINPGDNFLDVDDETYTGLMLVAKRVAKYLEKAFEVKRVGLVIEGEGVPHLHVKLIPMHGDLSALPDPRSTPTEFFQNYPGYLSTVGGPKMSDDELKVIQQKILDAVASGGAS